MSWFRATPAAELLPKPAQTPLLASQQRSQQQKQITCSIWGILRRYTAIDGPWEACRKSHCKLLRQSQSCFHLLGAPGDWLWSGRRPLPGKTRSASRPLFVSMANVSLGLAEGEMICSLGEGEALHLPRDKGEADGGIHKRASANVFPLQVVYVRPLELLHYPSSISPPYTSWK